MSPYHLRRLLAVVLGTLAFAALGGSQALAVDGGSRARAAGPQRRPARLDARVRGRRRYRAEGLAAALGVARRTNLDVAGDKVEVVIEADPGAQRGPHRPRCVRRARRTIVRRSDQGARPGPDLAGLAVERKGVRSVEPPQRARPAALTGQGVAASNATIAHAGGDKGAGVKVGIIDSGFAGFAARQPEGELPATADDPELLRGHRGERARDGRGGDRPRGRPRGAAAPDLHRGRRRPRPGQGLRNRERARLLNLSAGFYNTSRGDGSGGPTTPDGIVEAARAAGILWVVSAGNEAERHWSGTFTGGGNTSTTSRRATKGSTSRSHRTRRPASSSSGTRGRRRRPRTSTSASSMPPRSRSSRRRPRPVAQLQPDRGDVRPRPAGRWGVLRRDRTLRRDDAAPGSLPRRGGLRPVPRRRRQPDRARVRA